MEPIEIRGPGVRKQAIHFGRPAQPLFGFYYPPVDGPTRQVGIVLCNPLGTDQTRSDRTYRRLAEGLASAGFACLRFDFYGTGDSGGDIGSPGLVRTWVENVGIAADELRIRSGAAAIGLVGLRLGGTWAFEYAAERGDIDSLVLWSPCVSGAAFVAEVTRLHKIYARIEPQLAAAPPPREGGEEALGLFLPRALLGELTSVDMRRATRRPARRTLVIDGGNLQGGGNSPDRDALLDRLRDLGGAPELRVHQGQKFLITVSHRSLVPSDVIDSIAGWFKEVYPARSGAAERPMLPVPDMAIIGPLGERPVVFGEGHPLFGIYTPAAKPRARSGRPPIVIANAGCINRAGPHRMFVTMARRWADAGFDVLRVDIAGIGDSPAAPGTEDNLTYPVSGLADLRSAIRELGADGAIVAGLCSGGDFAFRLGAADANVVGAWMLNPRTFCMLDLMAVESGGGAVPLESVDEVPRALRAMADRGVDTLLVVSRNDPGVAYVDAHSPDLMRGLGQVPGFLRVDVDGSDHPFTPAAAQERVSDVLTDHLTTRFV